MQQHRVDSNKQALARLPGLPNQKYKAEALELAKELQESIPHPNVVRIAIVQMGPTLWRQWQQFNQVRIGEFVTSTPSQRAASKWQPDFGFWAFSAQEKCLRIAESTITVTRNDSQSKTSDDRIAESHWRSDSDIFAHHIGCDEMDDDRLASSFVGRWTRLPIGCVGNLTDQNTRSHGHLNANYQDQEIVTYMGRDNVRDDVLRAVSACQEVSNFLPNSLLLGRPENLGLPRLVLLIGYELFLRLPESERCNFRYKMFESMLPGQALLGVLADMTLRVAATWRQTKRKDVDQFMEFITLTLQMPHEKSPVRERMLEVIAGRAIRMSEKLRAKGDLYGAAITSCAVDLLDVPKSFTSEDIEESVSIFGSAMGCIADANDCPEGPQDLLKIAHEFIGMLRDRCAPIEQGPSNIEPSEEVLIIDAISGK